MRFLAAFDTEHDHVGVGIQPMLRRDGETFPIRAHAHKHAFHTTCGPTYGLRFASMNEGAGAKGKSELQNKYR